MAYTPQTWTDGDAATPVNATRMTHIEDGIDDAHDDIAALDTRVDALESAAAIPPGAVLANVYTSGAWPTRPTDRTDVVVLWLGPSLPGSGMLTNDLFLTV